MFSITEQVSTRLALGVCFALFASGCGGGESPVLTAPSNPVISGPPVLLTGPYSVTSVVADENGRPIEAASVDACCVGGFSYSGLRRAGLLLTDSSGRFRMTGIPAGALLWFRAFKDGYVQQCAAAPVTVQGDVAIDLALVSRANLTATAPSAPGFRSVSGTVVETTTTGKQPVAGVIVVFSKYEDFEPAHVYSDQAGRFHCVAYRRRGGAVYVSTGGARTRTSRRARPTTSSSSCDEVAEGVAQNAVVVNPVFDSGNGPRRSEADGLSAQRDGS